MIIIISGGVGSGKSLTAVRHAIEESKNNKILTNFKLKGIKHHRLKRNDVILDDEKGKPVSINWDFWEKNRNCDIFLDELHNIINSRSAQSKQNKLMSEWISQIRKIWGGQGDQNYINTMKKLTNNAFHNNYLKFMAASNNIYLITQRVRKIDINFRELSHMYIQCQKIKRGKKIYIINYCWFGDDNLDAIESSLMTPPKKTIFMANDYFKFYDSYQLISTGGEYL